MAIWQYILFSSCKYSITASCFNAGLALWTFIRCFREIILLPTSWRIFLFHSASTSVVILGFVETIRYMLESKPISISLLHLFQFIDIASRKLGPLLTSFVNLEFVIILISTVKTSHDSHPQNLYVFDSHILLSCAVCYIVICVNGIYSLFVI